MKTILQVDGCGVHSIIFISFVKEFEEHFKRKFLDHFDVISSCSFTSLVLMCLSENLNVEEIFSQESFKQLFQKKWHTPISKYFIPKYDSSIKSKFIKEYIPKSITRNIQTLVFNIKTNKIEKFDLHNTKNVHQIADMSTNTYSYYSDIDNRIDTYPTVQNTDIYLDIENHKVLSIGIVPVQKPMKVYSGGILDYSWFHKASGKFNASMHSLISKSYLGENYLRLDVDYNNFIEFDDVSDEMFARMNKCGKDLFYKRVDELKQFLEI